MQAGGCADVTLTGRLAFPPPARACRRCAQGRSAPTASDCLCWCANSAACAAYVWLGVNQTCWLQSEVNVAEGLEPDASPLTISGRIETTGPPPASLPPSVQTLWSHTAAWDPEGHAVRNG